MAKAEPSGFEGLLYRLGYASTRVREAVRQVQDIGSAAGGAPSDPGRRGPADPEGFHDPEGRYDDDSPHPLGSLAVATAAGALLTQVLRPRRVSWPRAILAGTIGTLLYDAETVVESRLRGRKFGTRPSLRHSLLAGGVRAQAERYAAGIGMAGFYAQFLYDRLPLPRVVQGVAYGLLEAGTRGWGGPVALLGRVSPELPIPSAYTNGIARPGEKTLEMLRRHVLFGLALGIIYRAASDGED